MRERILNQPLDTFNINEAAYVAKMALVNPRQLRIITLNPEMVVTARKNFEFQAAINNSHLIIPDGTGIVWASQLLNGEEIERVPGIELAEKILEAANELGKKVAIYGSKKEVLEKAVSKLKEKYPNIQIVKAINGYELQEKNGKVAEDIASGNPDLVLVALGSPKQEIWINKHALLFPRCVMIGIGGSLDIWSGVKKRAPEWMRNAHLEWLYRVITEPKRIIRILVTLPRFVWMVVREKYLH